MDGEADGKVADTSIARKRLEARVYKILKHELRRKILIRTGERPWSPTELAADIGEPLKRVCEQVAVLRDHEPKFLELVDERQGPKGGPPQRFYRAVVRLVVHAEDWALLPELTQAAQTITITEELHREWRESLASGVFYRDPDHALMRTALLLDRTGRQQVAELMIEAQAKLADVELESAERSRRTGENVERSITAFVSFPAAPSSE
jgi:hypothetical protein